MSGHDLEPNLVATACNGERGGTLPCIGRASDLPARKPLPDKGNHTGAVRIANRRNGCQVGHGEEGSQRSDGADGAQEAVREHRSWDLG